MTEIQTLEIEHDGKTKYCAVDNHNLKKGKSFQIIYKANSPQQLESFMIQKGLK